MGNREHAAIGGQPLLFRTAAIVRSATSPGETRRSLLLTGKAVARLVGSNADLKPTDFEELGDSFDMIANKMAPQLRIVLRLIAPLVLVGALVEVGRKILGGTSWYPAWQESRRRRRAEKEQRIEQPQAVAKNPVAATVPAPPAARPVAVVPEGHTTLSRGLSLLQIVPPRPLGRMNRGSTFDAEADRGRAPRAATEDPVFA